MRKSALLVVVLALMAVAGANATEYDIDKAHSSVGFKIKHMMVSNVRGQFADFAGSFTWDPANPAAAKVNATIQAASIDTGNEQRDAHLRSADFFDTVVHPTMTFVMTKLEPQGKDRYVLRGDLTMCGVTKSVALELEFIGEVADPKMGTRVGWEARGMIDRRDFGVNWSKTLDNGGLVLSDEVTIELAVEGIKKN